LTDLRDRTLVDIDDDNGRSGLLARFKALVAVEDEVAQMCKGQRARKRDADQERKHQKTYAPDDQAPVPFRAGWRSS
jgi:hypothetical protein